MELREKIINKIINIETGRVFHKYTIEKYAQKYFTEDEYKYIYSIKGRTLTERLWKIVNNIERTPKCKCGKELPFIRGWNGYQTYCSNSCTCIFRDNVDQERALEKRRTTCFNRYGKEFFPNAHTDTANTKRNETFIKRYGMSQYEYARQFVDEESKEKRIKSLRETYAKNGKEIQKKKEASHIKKYGCKWGQRLEDKQRLAENANKKTFYIYEEQKFDSSYELYFWVYCKDKNIKVQRNKKGFEYKGDDGKTHTYFPDFCLVDDGSLIEIKGSHLRDTKNWKRKLPLCEKYSITVYYTDGEECKKFRDYVWSEYGKDWIKQYKIRQQKRKVVFIDENTDIFEKRNDNVKYLYLCQKCGKEVVTSYKTIKCAGLVCKSCRKQNSH